jgi:quercetin dioxygenase-like cupin family protein
MKYKYATIIALVAGVALISLGGEFALHAQETPHVKRNILMKEAMSIPDREAVMVAVEIPPGVAEGRHTHPAEVYAFVLEGAISQEIEGKPTVTLKAGDVFHVASGQIHQATNNGSVTAKLAVVFVAEKGKPLTTPVK